MLSDDCADDGKEHGHPLSVEVRRNGSRGSGDAAVVDDEDAGKDDGYNDGCFRVCVCVPEIPVRPLQWLYKRQ